MYVAVVVNPGVMTTMALYGPLRHHRPINGTVSVTFGNGLFSLLSEVSSFRTDSIAVS
jgi:hypothetical protein